MTHSTSGESDPVSAAESPSLVQRVCPRCRRGARVDTSVTLCFKCGDTLKARGFCPICESFVNQPVGEYCDKHDVPLETEDPDEANPIDLASRRWVTIGRYPDRSAVEGLRIRLESEGIPTFLDGQRMGSSAMYQVATGGVKLQVPEEMVDEARVLISQVWKPLFEDPDDLDDAWDELTPSPGARFYTAMELVFYLLAGTVGLLMLATLVGMLFVRLAR